MAGVKLCDATIITNIVVVTSEDIASKRIEEDHLPD
jgi:hypothetical protein